jgi:hypothetical protein
MPLSSTSSPSSTLPCSASPGCVRCIGSRGAVVVWWCGAGVLPGLAVALLTLV